MKTSWTIALAVLAASGGAAPAWAQMESLSEPVTLDPPAFMVKDVGTAEPFNFNPGFGSFEELAGVYYFQADDGFHGNELWRTDGTPSGTWMLRDICPGFCSGAPFYFAKLGSVILFGADDGEHGWELWSTDGTAAGTQMVADILPGIVSSFPGRLLTVGTRVVFEAMGGLWGTDGTVGGTEELIPASAGLNIRAHIVSNGYAFVTASTGLWKTDGTPAGTEFLKAVAVIGNAGPIFGPSPSFAETNGVVVFAGHDIGPPGEASLWKSDGTAAGTIELSSSVFGPRSFRSFNGDAYFAAADSAGDELWRTDGTVVTMVKDINPGGASSSPSTIGVAGGYLVFRVGYPSLQIWRTDGSEGGTTKLIDMPPASSGELGSLAPSVTSAGKVFFSATDDAHGMEPWVSDGTALGTHLIADFFPGSKGSREVLFHPTLPIATPDGVLDQYFTPQGLNTWRTDGTALGSIQLLDADTQNSALVRAAGYHLLAKTAFDDGFAIGLADGIHGQEPWMFDGTAQGFSMLDLEPGPDGSGPGFSFGGRDKLFFTSYGTQTSGLWSAGNMLSAPEYVLATGSTCCSAINFGLDVVLGGDALVRSDGTASGTIQLTPPGIQAYIPSALGATILFGAAPGLWRSDGTPAGTVQVTHALQGEPQSVGDIHALSSIAVFEASDDEHGKELWATDGNAAGTQLLADIYPGPSSSIRGSPIPFLRVPTFVTGTALGYVAADDGAHGFEVWRTDGSPSGTMLLMDVAPGPSPSDPTWLAIERERLFFTADDLLHGRELWTSDGTAPGTHLVSDINPGSKGSVPAFTAGSDGKVYFSATDGVHGVELWESNGTAPGTRMSDDIVPGSGSSSPEFLTFSGPYLFFTANDGTHGFEVWAKTIPSRALAPSSLAIDDSLANANGLWEPGESVKLQPVWENLSISNITSITATASGTNGAQCSDGAASYGTFAPLDLRSCLSTGNCYAATLNGPRPSKHWDVTLHETLSTGKAYDWPIHIAGSFDDVADDDVGYADAEAFLHANLTAGCSATSYCPQDVVTRAQAALFISLGLAKGDANLVPFTGTVPGKGAYDCSQGGVSVFSDVDPEDPFCRFIHDLAARKITQGCSSDAYCPANALSRAQLALLLGNALTQAAVPPSFSGPGGSYDCSPGTPDIHFLDVDENNAACAAAHYLWARQISDGCAATSFCPDGAVARVTVAKLLVDAFELQLP